VIGDDAKAWVVHVACSKPKDLGYAAELWSRQALARHIREHAGEAGFPALSRAAKATVHRILAAQPLHPEKIRYYLERRDPDFETKMRNVLIVYQDVDLQNARRAAGEPASDVITVSVDEKPGVQAIANTAPDLPPVPGKHPNIARDHEYERLGTCSILAALDLQDGRVTARVEDHHRGVEFRPSSQHHEGMNDFAAFQREKRCGDCGSVLNPESLAYLLRQHSFELLDRLPVDK
jgi:hypothetical protein